jgi:hypothetical protein
MKRLLALVATAVAGALLSPLVGHTAQNPRLKPIPMAEETAFRILFGLGDTEAAQWDGGVRLNGGKITSIKGWRFSGDDTTDYASTWKLETRLPASSSATARKDGRRVPVTDNGVIVGAQLQSAGARFDVVTRQGKFSFLAQDVPLGEIKSVLGGRASVERVPGTTQLTTSSEDEDFPALAQRDDDIWVAFVQFVHGDRDAEDQPRQLTAEPKDFNILARPPGGDQVWIMHFSKSKNTWDPPIAVSSPKQDVMRAAVAIDGARRVWVIWSAGRNGSFDLYARAYSNGKWTPEKRLTTNPGTDINPVAATDRRGRVWVAWQGFRGDNLDILAAVQQGDNFSPEQRVSTSRQSDWDPAIAAAPNGDIAISWDTYDKGDYDVWVRRMRAGNPVHMDPPAPVAASPNFEARSSLAFDGRGRLWVAYESSFAKWGKDFGAYETTGVPLYQGHNIQLKCLAGGKTYVTADSLFESLPGPGATRRGRRRTHTVAPPPSTPLPNPALAARRVPNAPVSSGTMALNSFPRLAVDPEGGLYLSFRTPAANVRSPVGAVWASHIVYFDGVSWSGAIFVPRTDGLLDNRPALAALAAGRVLMVAAMDHRQSEGAGGRRIASAGVNSDLYAATFTIPEKIKPAQLKAVPNETVAPPQPDMRRELEQVAYLRGYRTRIGGQAAQLLRGDFHRHTEMSGDGVREGPLIDAYRYFIDAAYLDWGGCSDYDNGGGHEYFWWLQQKFTDAYRLGTRFIPMFSHERAVRFPEGHRNIVMAGRGVRPLPRLPKAADDSAPTPAPDTQMLYRYLRRFGGVAASHTSATDLGTDWRDHDPLLEPAVEIYQGYRQSYEAPGAPRAASEHDSIGGWRPSGFVSAALQKGYRLGFLAASDHISTHVSYCNLWVTTPTREGVMDALRKRRVYASTDNILADVRSGDHFMGEEFTTDQPPVLTVRLRGAAPFARVQIIRDGQDVYVVEPKSRDVNFTWKDAAARRGSTSYYYVRGEQQDGEFVWVSPMWITYR